MCISLCDDSLGIICTHRNNDLFSWWVFSYYINLEFTFLVCVVHYIVNFHNLVRWDLRESIFNFDDLLDIIFGDLCIWLVVSVRSWIWWPVFAKMLLLSLRGIDGEICSISACFPFASLLMVVFLIGIFLNYKDMHCLRYVLLISSKFVLSRLIYCRQKSPSYKPKFHNLQYVLDHSVF